MFISILLSGLGYFLLSPSTSVLLICLSRVICGCFKHTQTLCRAFLADLDADDNRSRREKKNDGEYNSALGRAPSKHIDTGRFGPFMTISTLGFVFGPILGGHISEFEGGFEVVAVVVAVIFLVNALLVGKYLTVDAKKHRLVKKDVESAKTNFFWVIRSNADIFLVQFLVSLSVMVIRTNYVRSILL